MSWRGIPAQVRATDAVGRTASRALPPSFQQEIDRVAMHEGLVETDAYLEGWAWSDDLEREGSPEEVCEAIVAELTEEWARRPRG